MIAAIERLTPRAASAARGLLGLAACAWLVEMVLAPTSRGVGAALSSRGLADLIGSGALGAALPRIVGAAWYSTPVGAAIVLVTLGLAGPAARTVRLVAALLAALAAAAFATFLARVPGVALGPGSWCGIAGAVLAVVAISIEGSAVIRLRSEGVVDGLAKVRGAARRTTMRRTRGA